jgi:hypothetical protein
MAEVEVEVAKPEELEEIRGHSFARRVALITAVYAVLLAITALGGNKAMKEMLLSQQQASDQWAFYQAKTIREHLYRNQRLRLELDLLEREAVMRAEARTRMAALIKNMTNEEIRFAAEKKTIELEAKKFEHERDMYRNKDVYFEYGEVLLQVAIVLASISILSSSVPVFCFSAFCALLGALSSLNAYLLIIRTPLFH